MGGDGPRNLVEEYDPATDSWTTKAIMPTARSGLRVVGGPNGKVYAIGGHGQRFSGDILNIVEEYDPATDAWVTKSNMPTARDLMGASATPDGKIFVVGGENFGGSVDNVEEYDVATDTWNIRSALPSPTEGLALVTGPNNKLYAFGGFSGGYTNASYEYDPVTDTWSSVESMPTARVQLSAAVGDNNKIYVIGGYNGAFLATNEEATIEGLNQPPTVDANGPYSVDEGSSIQVTAAGNDPENGSLTYAWDLDNSGSFETSGQTVTFNASNLDGPDTEVISVQVTDDGNLTDTDSTMVTINNVAPIVDSISLSENPTHINDSFTASASFADPGVLDTHIASWDWGDGNITTGTVTESNGSGSVSDSHTYTDFGNYTITLTVTDKDNASTSEITIIAVVKQIIVLNPAQVWLSKTANAGVRFDIRVETYKDASLVSSGQVDSIQVGNGGFNNADLVSVPFDSFSPIDFPEGSQLKITVLVRNACSGSLRNSGSARLWFSDVQADSHFGATIGTTNNNYYLRNSFLLSTIVGTGPRQVINVDAGTRCSPFKPFGTWSITP